MSSTHFVKLWAAFGPFLSDDDGGFGGFAESDFVGEEDAFGERECGVDLMGVEVDAGGGEGAGEVVEGGWRAVL